MDFSPPIPSSHATPSPCGRFVAGFASSSSSTNKLRITSTHAPERFVELAIRTGGTPAAATRDVTAVRWSEDSSRIAVSSAQWVEVVRPNEAGSRVRIDNGSGGLGRFACAEFVGPEQLLVVWEFGRAKIWDVRTGTGVEVGDVKNSSGGGGRGWQLRPASSGGVVAVFRVLATLSRTGAEDVLNLYVPALGKAVASVKLPSVDARALSWSPEGRWLAVLDAPTAAGSSVHVYTPDGHHFRSYPNTIEADTSALGVKALVWSRDSRILGLTKYNGRVVLLNTQTFTPLAIIEHTTTIDQHTLPPSQQAPIWLEVVSASGERSYRRQTHPVSPPITRNKLSSDPSELGVAEACFSCDGSYLATRDEEMLSTVWIWNTAGMSAHAVLIQHGNVRRMQWHPSQAGRLLLDCGEGVIHLFDASSTGEVPRSSATPPPAPATVSWLSTAPNAKAIIAAASKTSFRLCYPDGLPDEPYQLDLGTHEAQDEGFDEGISEDSLFDVLSGRKPLPPKTEPSYTERVDVEVATEEAESSPRLDDTFVGKKARSHVPDSVDPLDDSQIF